ncbi:MAG: alpha/beta fold hydrolase, partial [Planctomycetales bacterium]|nr:alpha/beta fold hydrolase [Planctomycetales bacterium]
MSVRKTPRNPLQNELNLLGWQGPSPSERTYQVLRRFGLEGVYHQDPQDALGQLRTIVASEPHLEPMYALAELSYIQGFKAKSARSHDRAMSLFAESLVTSYDYLFSPRLAGERNAYDPQFRGICDLYNVSLEEILRLLRKNGSLENGGSTSLVVDERVLPIEVRLEGRWHDSELEKLEFASDYEVEGLENKHHTYGLGVPLIAVRRDGAVPTIEDAFFPKGLSFPVTAFFREAPDSATNVAGAPRYVIQLLDPLDGPEVEIADRRAPLESDISTPLAYFMNDPVVGTHVLATFALLDADFAEDYVGLYMLEPYDPNKIPVVMVHGLWSSPTTWMEMFNDLRSMPEIRQNYQFWFYMYPSGQPFWKSAEQMREDLAKVVHTLDPDRRSTQMERMVLVGHSMGGLVSRLQTIDSGDRFWRLVSDKPLEQLAADQGSKHELQQVLYFEPNPFIQRVVSIGTPYHGSHFANGTTQWLSHQLFALSSQSTKETRELIEQNPNFFNNTDLLTINTSVDSLSPESPFLPVMLEAETAPWVHYHNVIGVLEDTSLLGKMGVQFQPEGDGIVPLDSARIPGVESELIVPAGHMVVHQHPLTILEVRRILLLHLAEGGRDVRIDRSIMPASHEQSPADVTVNHAIPASNPLPVVRLDDNGVPLASEP